MPDGNPRMTILAMLTQNAGFSSKGLDMLIYYEFGFKLRADAVMAGADTMLAGLSEFAGEACNEAIPSHKVNDASLPWLVITDSKGRLMGRLGHYRQMEYIRDVVVVLSKHSPREYLDYLDANMYRYITAGSGPDGRACLAEAVASLASRLGVHHIRVDAAGRLATQVLSEGLAQNLIVIFAPIIESAPSVTAFPGIKEDIRLELVGLDRLEGGYFSATYSVCG